MNEKQDSDFFWVSYTDLMTSLFFIMLALYALTLAVLMVKQSKLAADAKQLKRIREIERAVNEIDSSYFAYNSTFKKHVLKIDVSFPTGSADIYEQNNARVRTDLLSAGKEIIDLVQRFELEQEDIKYLVIVEGQASLDRYEMNYELSYQRALSLYRFWKRFDVDIDKIENIELIIAGSGTGGVPRELPDKPPRNQRFLIHIIPKVGTI